MAKNNNYVKINMDDDYLYFLMKANKDKGTIDSIESLVSDADTKADMDEDMEEEAFELPTLHEILLDVPDGCVSAELTCKYYDKARGEMREMVIEYDYDLIIESIETAKSLIDLVDDFDEDDFDED